MQEHLRNNQNEIPSEATVHVGGKAIEVYQKGTLVGEITEYGYLSYEKDNEHTESVMSDVSEVVYDQEPPVRHRSSDDDPFYTDASGRPDGIRGTEKPSKLKK